MSSCLLCYIECNMNTHLLHLRLTAMAVISVIFLCLTSCGDDEVVPPPGPNTSSENHTGSSDNTSTTFDASLLVGSWKTTFVGNDYEIYTFNTDLTFKRKGFVNGENFEETGTWTLDTNTKVLTLTYSYGSVDETEIVRLSDTELEFFGSTYQRTDGSMNEDGQTNITPGNNRGAVAKAFRGSGTGNDPYIISDASELRKLSDDCASGMTYRGEYFKMTADITINHNVLLPNGDLNGDGSNLECWIPIGMDQDHPFCGTFDGNGHTISGLYVLSSNKIIASGLFSWLAGTVQSLTIKDSHISGYMCAGSICGRALSFSDGKATYKAKIYNCISYSHVISTGWGAGGLVGDNACYLAEVDRCINYGRIDANAMGCGGIVGRSFKHSSIKNCVNSGNVSNGDVAVAGIAVVINSQLDVLNCANYGEIYDTRDDNAYARSCGICMYTSKAINNCINYGTVHFHGGLGYGLFNEIFNYRYNSMSNNQRNYYLETSCSKGYQYGGSTRTCISMTSNEMQKQAFLDELNTNAKAMGSNYSKWKFGKNGYPTLEFVKE